MARILAEGFPRSGNSYLYKLLLQSFPNHEVVQFTHSAAKINDSTLIVIRNPKDSIASFMNTFNEKDKTKAEHWWVRFYKTALEKTPLSNWIFFDTLTSSPNKVVKQVADLFNISAVQSDLSNLTHNKSMQSYSNDIIFNDASSLYQKIQAESNSL